MCHVTCFAWPPKILSITAPETIYLVPGLGQTFQRHEWSSQPFWVGGVNVPILQMRTLRLREGKESHSRLLSGKANMGTKNLWFEIIPT